MPMAYAYGLCLWHTPMYGEVLVAQGLGSPIVPVPMAYAYGPSLCMVKQ
jgi:hypothetical protein